MVYEGDGVQELEPSSTGKCQTLRNLECWDSKLSTIDVENTSDCQEEKC